MEDGRQKGYGGGWGPERSPFGPGQVAGELVGADPQGLALSPPPIHPGLACGTLTLPVHSTSPLGSLSPLALGRWHRCPTPSLPQLHTDAPRDKAGGPSLATVIFQSLAPSLYLCVRPDALSSAAWADPQSASLKGPGCFLKFIGTWLPKPGSTLSFALCVPHPIPLS